MQSVILGSILENSWKDSTASHSPFGGAAVAAFTRTWVAAAAEGGVAIGISITGRGWSPPDPK